MSLIAINQDWCKACGICVDLCPTDVLGTNEEGIAIVVNEDACIECELCELRCPDFAIELRGEKDE